MIKLLKNICSVIVALTLVFTFAFSVIATDDKNPEDTTEESGTVTKAPETDADTDTDVTIESIAFEKSEYVIYIGKSETVKITVKPEDITEYKVEYSTENKLIASVDEDGNVTAKGKGSTKLTAKCGDLTCETKITVIGFDLTIEEDRVTMEKFVSGFDLGTTVEEAKEAFANFKNTTPDNVKIMSGSSEVSLKANLATGMIIEENDVRYYIVIFGDVDGNGTITYDDTKTVVAVLSGGSFNNSACEKAALVNNNETITVKNALDISDYIRGKLAAL